MPTALPIATPPSARERHVSGRVVLLSLIGFFLVVAGANAVMITAALTTFGGARTESSYAAGQRFAAEHAAAVAQDALGWTVTAGLLTAADSAGSAAPERIITVTAADADGAALTDVGAVVRLEHPADVRRDLTVAMTQTGPGRFEGRVAAAHGQWDLVVDLVRGDATVFRSTQRIIEP